MATTAAPTVTREPLTRAIRSVDVVFDVISFSAGLHGAVADQDVRLESFCDNGHAPTKVRQTTNCPACSNDDRGSWRKGKERGGEITLVPKDEYEAIKAKIEDFKGKVEIKVVEANDELMVPAGDVYYLATKNARAGSGYPLLAALIRKRPKVAFLTELSTGGAPRLFRLHEDHGAIVLRELARPEALRERPTATGTAPQAAAVKRGEELVDALLEPFDPAMFHNRHTEDVAELIEKARPVAGGAQVGDSAEDLLERLQASVAKAKGESAPPTTAPARRPRRKSTAAQGDAA
jgi:non-homologous end joining protein Ku